MAPMCKAWRGLRAMTPCILLIAGCAPDQPAGAGPDAASNGTASAGAAAAAAAGSGSSGRASSGARYGVTTHAAARTGARPGPAFPTPMAAATPGLTDLCAPGEPMIFSCRLDTGKTLSICAAAQAGVPRFAQYRYGTPGQEGELIYPQTRSDGSLRFVSVPYSGGGEQQLSFSRRGTGYVVYSRMMRTGFDAKGNKPAFDDGVLVMQGEKILANHRCGPAGLSAIDYDRAERYAKKDQGGEVVYHD